jgi:hypothetical protein
MSSGPKINIKTGHIGGQEIVTRIPVMKLERGDSTIHKFAARALLGDLERGESWIQRDSRIQRNTFREQQWIRKEGERLGCKWSLVSKWTSFVAVKETIEEPGPEQEHPNQPAEPARPALDAVSSSIEQVDGDGLGLLRLRGPPTARAIWTGLGEASRDDLLQVGPGEQEDSDEDSYSSDTFSDESETENDGDHHDSTGSDNQGGAGGGAGASFGEAGGNSQGPQPGGMPPNESTDYSGTANDAGIAGPREQAGNYRFTSQTSSGSAQPAYLGPPFTSVGYHANSAVPLLTRHLTRPVPPNRIEQDRFMMHQFPDISSRNQPLATTLNAPTAPQAPPSGPQQGK